MQKKLHPSVIEFKEFVRNNPNLIREVRSGKSTWQELYEDWYLLGDEDTRWEAIGKEKSSKQESNKENDSKSDSNKDKKGDWASQILGSVQKMDPEQIQYYLNNLSQALGAIQGVISQFKGSHQGKLVKAQPEHKHPFLFRKD
ncbi:YlbD family protein [Neobacillus sp. K501]